MRNKSGLLVVSLLILIGSGIGTAYSEPFKYKYSIGTAFQVQGDVAIVTGYTIDSYELSMLSGKYYVPRTVVESWSPIEETWLQKIKRTLHIASIVGGIPLPDFYGDVNADGQITSIDSMFISQYVNNLHVFNQYQESAADVDNNGQVNIDDALWITKYVAGLPIPQDIENRLKTPFPHPSGIIIVQPTATPFPTPTQPPDVVSKKLNININPSVLSKGSNIPLNIQITTEDGTQIPVLVTLSGLESGTYQTDTAGLLKYYPNPTWANEGDINIHATQLLPAQKIYYEGTSKVTVQSILVTPSPTSTTSKGVTTTSPSPTTVQYQCSNGLWVFNPSSCPPPAGSPIPQGTPGFEALFAIAGLVAVAYLVLRQGKKKEDSYDYKESK